MKVIGVTGPTGAGKTTVLRALEELGCVCVDCDALYHRLLDTSPALRQELTDRFGKSILDSQGKVDRKALAALVFPDPQALEALNSVSHRHVLAACEGILAQAGSDGAAAVALDAVALIESGLAARCDVTLAVTAPRDLRLRRVTARDGIPEAAALSRMAAQQADEFYVNQCDRWIVNDGSRSPEELVPMLRGMLADILC